ncbi:aminopeptidase N [Mariprofundus aestuarium]|uniref:Aminopeptidase N n=1 Tax=Mariprofundus aestuarium TaxID=1921086 RepID=A0A2K8L458_MARES|nr:aminopeptidase N [Mariprofundus aestuarium]ATX79026.1 aminopeptidase N [Mariprofundus aestuarium]
MKQPQTVYLKDYQPPEFLVDHLSLLFTLHPSCTEVVSTARYRRNPLAAAGGDLELDGHGMELVSIKLDGLLLEKEDYRLNEAALGIAALPDEFELEVTTRINPEANTALEGLYRSGGNYCTQCEAQGFRRITYYQDRPDVMAPFDVRIVAEKQSNPVLLSNGNPTGSGELGDGQHWAEWSDPFAKPCYLFALVAGDLACVEDSYNTSSGRDVTLRIYTEVHHVDHCGHAMGSLKRAMAWDEQRFGLEYDLDLFMIVAVDDFNMGAMENKGLNIFNSRLVFASPETATDDDYIAIEAVIGHEYFHNWTGNRVTCRDWFQLSLKEGLTVFRDQEFTADTHSRAVKRIEDVRLLRTHQFAEDASPMAHPIRPSSYMEINNFYTVTVYEKGAEVVRLYQSLLGVDGFRRGMDLYFQRHDGQAVRTEDFLAAMADANAVDLSGMQRWYDQAGTPQLSVRMEYNEQEKRCTLHCSQCSPATPESAEKKPLPIPLTLGLLLPDGSSTPLQLEGESQPQGLSRTLLVSEQNQLFTFINVVEKPLPSLLRGFSAPVELDYPYSRDDDAFLMRFDSDAFNRWAAAQRLAMQTLLAMLVDNNEPDGAVGEAFGHLLRDASLDAALKAEALALPSEADIAESVVTKTALPADPARIHMLREQLRRKIAEALRDDLEACYHSLSQGEGLDDAAMQQRQLKNACLSLMVSLRDNAAVTLAYRQFEKAANMTDQYAALALLADCDCDERLKALEAFEKQWWHDANVMDKWFSVQAASTLPDTLERVKALMGHEKFDLRNPNKVRALIGTLAMRNPATFHAEDGSGYAFIADQVLTLDSLNPQVASRMLRALMNWKRIEPKRSTLMRSELQRIANSEGISGDVFEILSKSLC